VSVKKIKITSLSFLSYTIECLLGLFKGCEDNRAERNMVLWFKLCG